MKSPNNYIGDDKFAKLLEHYKCPTPADVVKARFVGSICSPNLELRPTDVISSFWLEGQEPRLETKEEADLFFKFFMGAWDDAFEKVKKNDVRFPPFKKDLESLKETCRRRFDVLEWGFVEGFWGGKQDLKIPAYIAEIIDSLSDVAGLYQVLLKKLDKKPELDEIAKTISHSDSMAEKAIAFIIENSVLPRIESLKREVN
ncbi:MAG: hypothetical protein SO314_00115 [Alphaproteobacteria bacterium]|nr:hypothetical protein [Alphaproteobacteria bacterium]